MNAQNLMSELSAVIGIHFAFNNDNVCSITFSEDKVDFEASQGPHGEILFIIANLTNAAELIENKSILDRLLRANYLNAQTRGATISLSSEGFMIHRQLAMPMEYPDFEKALEDFINALRYWKEWLALPHEENVSTISSESNDYELNIPMHTMLRI